MFKRILHIKIILMATVVFVHGQDPTPTPFSSRPETGVEKVRRLERAHERLAQQTYNNLYGQENYTKGTRYSPEWRAKMVSLYRKPDKEETAVLSPDEIFRQEYAEFLKQPKTGILKLIPDQDCAKAGKVINASPECANYAFPGAGSSYSFRLNSYRIKRLADITLIKNVLSTRSVFNGAIYVGLGDVPIKDITLNTPELIFLSQYKPVKTANEALQMAKQFSAGVKKNGFMYGRGILINKDRTFAMRSIAYRGKLRRSENGVVYNELDFDKRRDVIVVFRIVDVTADGSPTLVWKLLKESKAPKLIISEK